MYRAQWTETGVAVSTVREIDFSADSLVRALLKLDPSRRVSILDSCNDHPPYARHLIAAFDPFEIVEAYGDELHISRPREGEERSASGDVLSLLDARLQS